MSSVRKSRSGFASTLPPFFVIGRGSSVRYKSVQEGIIPEETLLVIGAGNAFDNPYFRSIWPTVLRPSFSGDFVEFFEGLPWNSGGEVLTQ